MVVCYNCYLLSQVKVHTQFYLVLISTCLCFQYAFFSPCCYWKVVCIFKCFFGKPFVSHWWQCQLEEGVLHIYVA